MLTRPSTKALPAASRANFMVKEYNAGLWVMKREASAQTAHATPSELKEHEGKNIKHSLTVNKKGLLQINLLGV